MKLYEIVVLFVLIIGIVLVLAFGTKMGSQDVTVSEPAAVNELIAEDTSDDTSYSQSSAFIDFKDTGEYLISGLTVANTPNSLTVTDESGKEIARFDLDEDDNLVPAASQPEGIEIRNAWVGPKSRTESKFNIYGPVENEDEPGKPILALLYESGNVSITAGDALVRSTPKSIRKTTVRGGNPPPSQQGGGRRRRGGGGGDD